MKSSTTTPLPPNAEHLKGLCLACAKDVLASLKARGKQEPAAVGPPDWLDSTVVGPDEWHRRYQKALKWVTTDELAAYLDAHGVRVLTPDQKVDLLRMLDMAERHMSNTGCGDYGSEDYLQLTRARAAIDGRDSG